MFQFGDNREWDGNSVYSLLDGAQSVQYAGILRCYVRTNFCCGRANPFDDFFSNNMCLNQNGGIEVNVALFVTAQFFSDV